MYNREIITRASTATYLNIGTNATYYVGDTGYAYASYVLARTKAHWGMVGTGWIDAKSDYQSPSGYGSGYALGSIGRQVSITGSGSRTATVNIKGKYNGTLQVAGVTANLVHTSAYASVDVEIYEGNVSTGELTKIAGSNAFSRDCMKLCVNGKYHLKRRMTIYAKYSKRNLKNPGIRIG